MTWNIENFAKAGNRTVAQVAAIVRAMDADVVALQEIESREKMEAWR